MKKFVYSDVDSSSATNLKIGTLYSPDFDVELRMKTEAYDDGIGYIKFIPNVLDSSVLTDGFGDFNVRVGNNSLAFVHHNNTADRLLVIDSNNNKLEVGSKIETNANLEFTSAGVKFSNGDYITKNPTRWSLIASRNFTDTAITMIGYVNVEDFVNRNIEIMIVAKTGNEYTSTIIPTEAFEMTYPAEIPIHKGGTHLASVLFAASTDGTFSMTVIGADNVKVFAR